MESESQFYIFTLLHFCFAFYIELYSNGIHRDGVRESTVFRDDATLEASGGQQVFSVKKI